MEKYHFNIAINKIYQHAGTKANVDCKKILLSNGYTDMEIAFIKAPYLLPVNLIKLLARLTKYYFKIGKGALIVSQYPLLGINKVFYKYTGILRSKGCKFGCVIHDLDSLRAEPDEAKIQVEIKSLSAYDFIIAHNPSMGTWLKQNGYKGDIIEITLFDYLTGFTPETITGSEDLQQVVFAGNLGRCDFLPDITKVKNVKFNLYGPGITKDAFQNYTNICWHGSFSNDAIIYNIKGKFGLIWDGPSIYECTGLMGNYLKFNTPHKLSLYLTAGLPVILPKTAAMANFVVEKGIGFTVSSLLDMPAEIKTISAQQYHQMRTNVLSMGKLLKRGHYLSTALCGVENFSSNEVHH